MDKKQLEEIRAFVTHIEGVIKRDVSGSLHISDAVHKVRGLVEADLKSIVWLEYLEDAGMGQ